MPLILKSHLCGVAVAFERYEKSREQREFEDQAGLHSASDCCTKNVEEERPQGSLYSWQKRKIADACEYMRKNAEHKPLIFVATSPGFTSLANEGKLISKLTHNMRNGYGVKNYVWVREFTKKGFPHFHFVADMPNIDFVDFSVYWSSLFNSTAKNSIRFGSRPGKDGKRIYHLKTKQHAWYLTKYLGKEIGKKEKISIKEMKTRLRTFAVSQELTKLSAPIEYEGQIDKPLTANGVCQRVWRSDDERYYERGQASPILSEEQVQNKWNWKAVGDYGVYKGYPKEWKFKTK